MVTGGIGVATGVTGTGACDVQPARRTAAMQMTRSMIVFLSILKIGGINNKPDGDHENVPVHVIFLKKVGYPSLGSPDAGEKFTLPLPIHTRTAGTR
jgi:hypothetical protein